MKWKFIESISFGFFWLVIISCGQSDYTRLVKSELEKGVRQDSILLGIRFGDTQQDFFGKCFDLNQQHLVTQGPVGLSVRYDFLDSLVHKKPTDVVLLFSPTFDSTTRISEIKMELSYKGWAPWNRPLQSDSLKEKVQALLMKWYGGNDFVLAQVGPDKLPVKVDGNRRLLLRIKDAQSVEVFAQDLLHPAFMHSVTAKEKTNQ